jgi:hypothetical protein
MLIIYINQWVNHSTALARLLGNIIKLTCGCQHHLGVIFMIETQTV